jgi:hypothetical protein
MVSWQSLQVASPNFLAFHVAKLSLIAIFSWRSLHQGVTTLWGSGRDQKSRHCFVFKCFSQGNMYIEIIYIDETALKTQHIAASKQSFRLGCICMVG